MTHLELAFHECEQHLSNQEEGLSQNSDWSKQRYRHTACGKICRPHNPCNLARICERKFTLSTYPRHLPLGDNRSLKYSTDHSGTAKLATGKDLSCKYPPAKSWQISVRCLLGKVWRFSCTTGYNSASSGVQFCTSSQVFSGWATNSPLSSNISRTIAESWCWDT